MAISKNLDGVDHVRNFESVFLGPGIYVLYDGRRYDSNIVYIGKSTRDIMIRIGRHHKNKDFDRVGVILPKTVSTQRIHNIEAFVIEEYIDRYGELPPYNQVQPRQKPGTRRFNWHSMARRREEVCFGSGSAPSRPSHIQWAVQVGIHGRCIRAISWEEAFHKVINKSEEESSICSLLCKLSGDTEWEIVERWRYGKKLPEVEWSYRIGRSGRHMREASKRQAQEKAYARSLGTSKICYLSRRAGGDWEIIEKWKRGFLLAN
mgnify:CR=1 FL=1